MTNEIPKPSSVQSNIQYIVITVIMFSLGMVSVILVSIMRPGVDNSILITAILGFTGTTLASILGFMKSQETHASVNSRMDEFIKRFEESSLVAQDKAKAEGIMTGRIEGRRSADARTDVLAAGKVPATIAIEKEPVEQNPVIEIQKNTKETVEILKDIKETR